MRLYFEFNNNVASYPNSGSSLFRFPLIWACFLLRMINYTIEKGKARRNENPMK